MISGPEVQGQEQLTQRNAALIPVYETQIFQTLISNAIGRAPSGFECQIHIQIGPWLFPIISDDGQSAPLRVQKSCATVLNSLKAVGDGFRGVIIASVGHGDLLNLTLTHTYAHRTAKSQASICSSYDDVEMDMNRAMYLKSCSSTFQNNCKIEVSGAFLLLSGSSSDVY